MTRDERVMFRTTAEQDKWLDQQAEAQGRKKSDWIFRHFEELRKKGQTKVDKRTAGR